VDGEEKPRALRPPANCDTPSDLTDDVMGHVAPLIAPPSGAATGAHVDVREVD